MFINLHNKLIINMNIYYEIFSSITFVIIKKGKKN